MTNSRIALTTTIVLLTSVTLHAAAVRMVPAPPTTTTNDFYVSNAKPLTPSPLLKLPIERRCPVLLFCAMVRARKST